MKRFYIIIAMVVAMSAVAWIRVYQVNNHASESNASSPEVIIDTSTQNPEQTKVRASRSFDKSRYSTTDPTSPWVIVNKKLSLNPMTYSPNDLTSVGNGQFMRKQAALSLFQMFKAASQQGLNLIPLSGYRSYQNQVSVYGNEVKQFGQAIADSESAKPGHSEHQTGWAIDIGGGGCGIDNCFGNTKEGKWVAANSYRYGYIIRYTAEKQSVTGYRAEPWHIRYIGKELAIQLHNTGYSTLEEFFNI